MTLAAVYLICTRSVPSSSRIADLTRLPFQKSELRSASFACGGKTEIWAKIDLSSEFQKSELRTQIDFWAACGHGLSPVHIQVPVHVRGWTIHEWVISTFWY